MVRTCESVSSFILKIPHGIQQLLLACKSVELPLCAGVSAVLAKPWNQSTSPAIFIRLLGR